MRTIYTSEKFLKIMDAIIWHIKHGHDNNQIGDRHRGEVLRQLDLDKKRKNKTTHMAAWSQDS
ncbi:hypothetical protein DPMN_165407 [Dreissena polymorpha]|uniref:Uncharacterized protein n=1 Tax=Dreissena polymorpha TaxID=45954 RepID=A0A9D4EZL7_DREPO|nr:hypothetical protein DPMN_165407 [Dreissena polymorpha]